MDSFKKALKIAISKRVAGIRQSSDSQPELILSPDEYKPIASLDIATSETIITTIDQFLNIDTKEINDDASIYEGELNIVDFGEIKLLAQKSAIPTLYAIFPGELQDQLINHFKYTLSMQSLEQASEAGQSLENNIDKTSGNFSFKGGIDLPSFNPQINQIDEENNQQDEKDLNFDKIPGISIPELGSPSLDQNKEEIHLNFSNKTDSNKEKEPTQKQPENSADFFDLSSSNNDDKHDENKTTIIPDSDSFNSFSLISSSDQDNTNITKDEGSLDEQVSMESDVEKKSSDYQPLDFLSSNNPSKKHDQSLNIDMHTPASDENSINFDEDTKITDVENDVISLAESDPAEAENNNAISNDQYNFKQEYEKSRLEDTNSNIIVSDSAPITSIIRSLLDYNASDLYLSAGSKIFFRIDTRIHEIETDIISDNQILELLSEILTPYLKQEFDRKKSTRFTFEINSIGRFRINVFKGANGTNVILRHIPLIIPTLRDIKAPEIMGALAKLSNGLFLVTGSSSSGKTTTLASMVDHINKLYAKHIITLEEPIEFRFEARKSIIHQKQIPTDVDSLPDGISSSLGQNPDIIVIHDLNDKASIELALEAALTGHIIVAGVRAKSITAAFDRLLGFFDQSKLGSIHEQLAGALCAVVHQNLLRKKEGGSLTVFESLVIDQSAKRLISEGNHHLIDSHIQAQKDHGEKPIKEMLIDLIQDNIISPSEALRHITDKANFIRELQKHGYDYDFEDVS